MDFTHEDTLTPEHTAWGEPPDCDPYGLADRFPETLQAQLLHYDDGSWAVVHDGWTDGGYLAEDVARTAGVASVDMALQRMIDAGELVLRAGIAMTPEDAVRFDADAGATRPRRHRSAGAWI